MSYTITEGWATDPSNLCFQLGLYTVRSEDPGSLVKTFRWYADAERYRDTLNEGASTETTADDQDDPDSYRDLLIDDQMGVR